jgi:hypothetical protein
MMCLCISVNVYASVACACVNVCVFVGIGVLACVRGRERADEGVSSTQCCPQHSNWQLELDSEPGVWAIKASCALRCHESDLVHAPALFEIVSDCFPGQGQ